VAARNPLNLSRYRVDSVCHEAESRARTCQGRRTARLRCIQRKLRPASNGGSLPIAGSVHFPTGSGRQWQSFSRFAFFNLAVMTQLSTPFRDDDVFLQKYFSVGSISYAKTAPNPQKPWRLLSRFCGPERVRSRNFYGIIYLVVIDPKY